MVSKNREDYRFYKIWSDMKQRCNNPNNASFYNYSGRGIQYAFEWMFYENFKRDMYPSYLEHCKINGNCNTTLDRIDVNDHYYKDNCRWADKQLQRVNIRNKEQYCGYNLITNQFYNFNNCTEFCRQLGFNRKSINAVINGEQNLHHNCIFSKYKEGIYKELKENADSLLKQHPEILNQRIKYMENRNV